MDLNLANQHVGACLRLHLIYNRDSTYSHRVATMSQARSNYIRCVEDHEHSCLLRPNDWHSYLCAKRHHYLGAKTS